METEVEIVGVNDESFIIAGERAGDKGVVLRTDVSGFYDPEVKVVSETPANFPGGRYVSHRVQIRRLTFAVDIYDDGSGCGSWHGRDSEWRKAWAYDKPTEIRVTTQDGTRSLFAHLEKIDVDLEYDPHVNEVTKVVMTVVAYDPFWYEAEEVHTKTVSGSGSDRFEVENANPTDQNVWPVWVVSGGTTWNIPDYDFTDIAQRYRKVKLPALAPDEHVVVNTNPRSRQLVSATKTPVWQRMNGKRFRNPVVPYRGKTTFVFEYENAPAGATIQLRLERPFSRPWGLF